MGPIDSVGSRPPTVSMTLALIIYVLYLLTYFTGITALIGVIIAHVQAGGPNPVLDSHYRFQIRTFWIGLLYVTAGLIVSAASPVFIVVGFNVINLAQVIGLAVLLWWFIWWLIRNLRGILALRAKRRVADPGSWMFG